jgi:hypothetical protein
VGFIEPQPESIHVIEQKDLDTTKGTRMVNDCIMIKVLRMLCVEDKDVHVVSPQFVNMMRNPDQGPEYCKKMFCDPQQEQQDKLRTRNKLRTREKMLPSPFAKVLIFPVHTDPHWSILIQDVRGVGLANARWRYFDTWEIQAIERARALEALITSSFLWMDGMHWQTVDTPLQDSKNNDCEALTCSETVAYVRWSRNRNHTQLNTRDLEVTNRQDPVILGKTARWMIHDAAKDGEIPMNHISIFGYSFRSMNANQGQGRAA